MKPIKSELRLVGLAAFLALPILALTCAAPSTQTDTPRSGAELWQQNCNFCHEYRSPASYSDAQWDTIVLHMRTRANIPAEDARLILAFLQSSN